MVLAYSDHQHIAKRMLWHTCKNLRALLLSNSRLVGTMTLEKRLLIVEHIATLLQPRLVKDHVISFRYFMTQVNLESLIQFQSVIKPYFIDCEEVYLRISDFIDDQSFVDGILQVCEKLKPRKLQIQLRDYNQFYSLKTSTKLTLADYALKASSETYINTISKHFMFSPV